MSLTKSVATILVMPLHMLARSKAKVESRCRVFSRHLGRSHQMASSHATARLRQRQLLEKTAGGA